MKRRVNTRKRRAVGGMWTFKRPTKAEYWKTKPVYWKNTRNKTRNYATNVPARKQSSVPVDDYQAAPSPIKTVEPGFNLISFLSERFDTPDAIFKLMEENMPLLAHDNYSAFVNLICGINKYPFIKSYVWPNYADTIQKIANDIIDLVEKDDKLARYMKKIVERINPNKTPFGGVAYLENVLATRRNEWGTEILWPENLRRFIARMNQIKVQTPF